MPAPFGFAQPSQRIGRLAGLGDRDDQRVLFEGRIAVTELTRVFHLDRKVSKFFEQILAHERGVPTGATSRQHNVVHRAQLGDRHVQTAEFSGGFIMIDAAAHGVPKRRGLLKNFLEHVVRILAPLRRLGIEVNLADLNPRDIRTETENTEFVSGDRDHIVVIQINNLIGMAHHCCHIAR